jgi:hypothetical protein
MVLYLYYGSSILQMSYLADTLLNEEGSSIKSER